METGRKGPSHGNTELLKTLLEYVIKVFYPEVGILRKNRHLSCLFLYHPPTKLREGIFSVASVCHFVHRELECLCSIIHNKGSFTLNESEGESEFFFDLFLGST